MNLLEEFNKEFIKRHDFYSDELDVFINKWKNKTEFKNIPEAWIIPIDSMLLELEKLNILPPIIEQDFGQLLILFKLNHIDTLTSSQKIDFNKIYRKTLELIEAVDEDLYLLLDIEVGDVRNKYWNQNQISSQITYH